MSDITTMMRDQARSGLQRELDEAVTNGDTEAARKVGEKIATMAVQMAPKAPPFGDADIRTEMDKLPWFGTDPKRSARAVELGKSLDIKKFSSAAAFAEALVKAVDEEFKPAGGDEPGDDEEPGEDEEPEAKPAAKRKATDGPGEGDATQRNNLRRASAGPWVKMSDAPADVQKEIRRAADKHLPTGATKEQREGYERRALESHYGVAQRAKGKK